MKGIATASASGVTKPRDNREAILIAVARVIASRGVRGLRIEDVAAEAGVSTPLLYYHFGNRAGLVKAALEHASDRAPSSALREPQTESGFEAVSTALLNELSDRPDVRDNAVVWGEVSASAVFEPELRRDVQRANEAWRKTVCVAIETGIADGSVRRNADPDAAADQLISLVDGLCTRWLAGTMTLARATDLLADA